MFRVSFNTLTMIPPVSKNLFFLGYNPGCNEHFTNRCVIYPCTHFLSGEDAFSSVVQRTLASRMFAITFQKIMLNGLIKSVPSRSEKSILH